MIVRDSINEMVDRGDFCGEVVDVTEILEFIREKWGSLDDECGCFINGNWLSIRDVAKMIVENAYCA